MSSRSAGSPIEDQRVTKSYQGQSFTTRTATVPNLKHTSANPTMFLPDTTLSRTIMAKSKLIPSHPVKSQKIMRKRSVRRCRVRRHKIFKPKLQRNRHLTTRQSSLQKTVLAQKQVGAKQNHVSTQELELALSLNQQSTSIIVQRKRDLKPTTGSQRSKGSQKQLPATTLQKSKPENLTRVMETRDLASKPNRSAAEETQSTDFLHKTVNSCTCYLNSTYYSADVTDECDSYVQRPSLSSPGIRKTCPFPLKFDVVKCNCFYHWSVNCSETCTSKPTA